MSLQTRKELLIHVQDKYRSAKKSEKIKILDGLIATTGYRRKYAINLLNQCALSANFKQKNNRSSTKKYDEAIRQALLTLWYAANQICSKRLVPFIPDLLTVLERCGHISLPVNVRSRLLKISPATVDRLLETERKECKRGLSTTRPGSLLKRQIKIRTFADWNDVVPGFLEGDLVAHCGDRVDGSFLNTLVLTDIASTWTEFFPLLRRSEADVIGALKIAQQLLPFLLLGLDTDNGSEFINYALLGFCEVEKITFTRARAYRKNDQAHVEEKNGSIVRRIVGYDRYEGLEAYNALAELYAVLRLYVNFFQPSLKLLSKERNGSKVTKKYDKAKTPCQRLLSCSNISEEAKDKLRQQYEGLDPVGLLKDLEKLQDNFWKHAWKSSNSFIPLMTNKNISVTGNIALPPIQNVATNYLANTNLHEKNIAPEGTIVKIDSSEDNDKIKFNIRRYRHTNKPRKKAGPRTWRTRTDPFDEIWNQIRLQLELNPEYTAKSLLDNLIKEKPGQYNINLLRTLQRRVADWRMQQIKTHQDIRIENIQPLSNDVGKFIALTTRGASG